MSSNDEHFIAHQAHQRFNSTPREIIGVSGTAAGPPGGWRAFYPPPVLLTRTPPPRLGLAALLARKNS